MTIADVIAIGTGFIAIISVAYESARAKAAEKSGEETAEGLRREIEGLRKAIGEAATSQLAGQKVEADREWIRREVGKLIDIATRFHTKRYPSELPAYRTQIKLVEGCTGISAELAVLSSLLDTIEITWANPASPLLGSINPLIKKAQAALERIVAWLGKL